MIYNDINNLIEYGISCNLLTTEDRIFCTNLLLSELGLDEYDKPTSVTDTNLETILQNILNFAVEKGLISDDITSKDLFDTKIMASLMPRPSTVISDFWKKYEQSPKQATDFYYKLSCDSDYIRRYRICKDVKWVTNTEYGDLDITINLSKPEKDPKAIAAAKNAKQSGYPKCLLCIENEGYAGRVNHPARQNHRIIPMMINDTPWMMQYSPYVYYNEHCIVFNQQHTPMKIDVATFKKLLDFVKLFPHYFVGSNADLPIVGGSILTHDHFQGGCYDFAMAKAEIETPLHFAGFDDVEAGIVKWPMSVIRICSENCDKLIELGSKILDAWRSYTDESSFIFAFTNDTPHNTITPIARKRNGKFELDLVLRNNITTEEHPLGVYHPHNELHHIKKENIGLIEVMGLAVLPARLKEEMRILAEKIVKHEDLLADENTAKHSEWVSEFSKKYSSIDAGNVTEILNQEIGLVFSKVLEHAGVFKRDDDGKAAFIRFANSVK